MERVAIAEGSAASLRRWQAHAEPNPKPLLGRRRGPFVPCNLAVCLSSGPLDGTSRERFDYQEPYLRHILGFIGLTDVTFIHTENQKPGVQAELARSASIEIIQKLVGEGVLTR